MEGETREGDCSTTDDRVFSCCYYEGCLLFVMMSVLNRIFNSMMNRAETTMFQAADLRAVSPGRFQVLDIDNNCSIKGFVLENGLNFKVGRGFYEFTKTETIQGYKEIVLMDKVTGDMFTGSKARELANISDHEKKKKIRPPPSDKWIMFIQSTSYNRKLIGGTRFLYEASMDSE